MNPRGRWVQVRTEWVQLMILPNWVLLPPTSAGSEELVGRGQGRGGKASCRAGLAWCSQESEGLVYLGPLAPSPGPRLDGSELPQPCGQRCSIATRRGGCGSSRSLRLVLTIWVNAGGRNQPSVLFPGEGQQGVRLCAADPGGTTCLCRRGRVIVPGMSLCPGMAFLSAASIVGTGFVGTLAPCGDAALVLSWVRVEQPVPTCCPTSPRLLLSLRG